MDICERNADRPLAHDFVQRVLGLGQDVKNWVKMVWDGMGELWWWLS